MDCDKVFYINPSMLLALLQSIESFRPVCNGVSSWSARIKEMTMAIIARYSAKI